MSFNYGLEKKRFDAEWARLRKEYAEAGMEEDAIQQMYEYDLKMFNRRRADANHEQPFVGKCCDDSEEDDESKSALYIKFLTKLSCVDTYTFSNGRFSWIETIENEMLYSAVQQLSEKEKELLSKIVVDCLKSREIAVIEGVTESAIAHRIRKIRCKISKICNVY